MTENNLQKSIRDVERSLKQDIETFFLHTYPLTHLISHGLDHHKRVWEYAKEIISYCDLKINTDKQFIKELLIACFFHDIGMAVNHGINHGDTSLKKTIEFMESMDLNPSDFINALNAIEYHDDKEYLSHPGDNKVLEILSVADDLDAFGLTGVYRYAEIYLRRGISFGDIGFMIIKNALSRFENLEKKSWLTVEYMRRQRERYNYLINFFMEYNSQLDSYNFSSAYPSGPCGIIQLLSEGDAGKYMKNPETYSTDKYISNFFIQLNAEIGVYT
jgi:hypothetical protein